MEFIRTKFENNPLTQWIKLNSKEFFKEMLIPLSETSVHIHVYQQNSVLKVSVRYEKGLNSI